MQVTPTADPGSSPLDFGTRMMRTDRYVGARIRACRTSTGLSLQQLGAMVGVSAPQLHKYELGTNRVTVGRLHLLALALRVEISWLLDGIGAAQEGAAEPTREHPSRRNEAATADSAASRLR